MKAWVLACLAVATCCVFACNQPSAAPPAAAPPVAAPPATAAAPAAPAANSIPELPDYPGATQASYELGGPHDGWTRSFEKKLTASASFADVKTFYLSAIAQNGWQVAGVKEQADEVEWQLGKGTSVAKVEIEAQSFGPTKIALERRDR